LFVLSFGGGEIAKQLACVWIAARLSCADIELRGVLFHARSLGADALESEILH